MDCSFEKKNAPILKNSFENILKTSKRKPKLIGTDDGKEFFNKVFTDFIIERKMKKIESIVALHEKEQFLLKKINELSEIFLSTLFSGKALEFG